MNAVIKVESLEHVYGGKFRALDGVDFEVNEGEIFGVLGPNGAGKTTLVKILSTLLVPTKGSVYIKGIDILKNPRRIKRVINVCFGGDQGLYWNLTGRENLAYFMELYRCPRKVRRRRIEELIEFTKLGEKADALVRTYSAGMKQRLQIARALVNDPEIVYFDEPLVSLDVHFVEEVISLMRSLAERGKTLVVTTHSTSLAERVCNRVLLLDRGRVLFCGNIYELSKMLRKVLVRLKVHGINKEIQAKLRNGLPCGRPRVKKRSAQEAELQWLCSSWREALALSQELSRENWDDNLEALEVKLPPLKDLFLEMFHEP